MNTIKKVGFLIGIIVLELLAVAYDAVLNQSRIIKPIDLHSYKFVVSDLPLLIMTVVLVLYVLFFVISMLLTGVRKCQGKGADRTRRLNPRFGWLGFLGLLGFSGIPFYMTQQQVWPFFFFAFFGFFGFFYEGKLSGTLIDERFQEEATRAQLVSYKTGFLLLCIVTWFSGYAGSHLNTDSVAIIYTVASSLIIALVVFLSNYLLYKYDSEEME